MKKSLIKKMVYAVLATACFSSPILHAAPQSENIDVTPDNKGTTPEELAAIYVLSEVCPSYGMANDDYQAGYAKLVKEYLPEESNPVDALNQRAKQKSFKKYLVEARQDAKKAGDAQNKDICKEITTIK